MVFLAPFFPSVSRLLDESNNYHKDSKEIFMRLHHGNNVYMKRNIEKLSTKLINTVNCLSCFPIWGYRK